MILQEKNMFLLQAGDTAMLLRINQQGLLEQLHFGGSVAIEDGDALAFRSGLGWGGSILLDDRDSESCPDFCCFSAFWGE